MATTEQVQEALQQLQAQGARIAALETQLQIESARAQTAEHMLPQTPDPLRCFASHLPEVK